MVTDCSCDVQAGDYACNNVDLLSFTPIAALGSTYADTRDEIAIIGMMDGTAFVKATDPINPVVLGFLPQTGATKVIWADMKVYNDHVFITRESQNHGMQVMIIILQD